MDMTIVDVVKAEKGRTQLYTRPSFLFYFLSLFLSLFLYFCVCPLCFTLFICPFTVFLFGHVPPFSTENHCHMRRASKTLRGNANKIVSVSIWSRRASSALKRGSTIMTTMMMVISRSFDIISFNHWFYNKYKKINRLGKIVSIVVHMKFRSNIFMNNMCTYTKRRVDQEYVSHLSCSH